MQKYVLVACCSDKVGIVHSVSSFFYQINATIVEAAQFTDPTDNIFFMRWEFGFDEASVKSLDEVKSAFNLMAIQYKMQWNMFDATQKPKMLIAVSKYGHCLMDLLYRWSEEQFFADIQQIHLYVL